jgi:glycosyltransferase involved in cell wall biosynthesis
LLAIRKLSTKIKVAHITAHVGGGVGVVLENFFAQSQDCENYLFCLDKCESNFSNFNNAKFASDGVAFEPLNLYFNMLEVCDIVLLHYWNHPLMAKFLSSIQIPSCRLIIWCHNSGLHSPHIVPNYLSRMAQKIIFTSSCSMQAPNIEILGKSDISKYLGVVHSTRSLSNFIEIGLKRSAQSTGRNLLYLGTVSKAKMHPTSAEILSKLSRQGNTIDVVGGPDNILLASEVASMGGKIQTYGSVRDVVNFYKKADVFIYPLRNDHYGTGEQVILEALASGLPVVAFDNPAEKAILVDGNDSILVSTSNEFVEAVSGLINDTQRMHSMALNAVSRIQKNFNAQEMSCKLVKIFYEILSFEKLTPNLPAEFFRNTNELSLYALNSFFDERIYESIIRDPARGVELVYSQIKPDLSDYSNAIKWLDTSKSTPFHYQRYFPDCPDLKLLTELIKGQIEICKTLQ